jgi:alkanesulfonate monooxygenase SsuD/methylene tetrahydromethanopterin reductase-like flavin-dependent oxidoreductase (luciferase family)
MGARITFGLGLNVNESVRDVARKSIVAEGLGFEYVWISDSPSQLYGPIVAAVVAAKTSKIKIGLGVMSPFLHSPRQIAATMNTLVDSFGPRFEVCVGAGDRIQLEHVGIHLIRGEELISKIVEAGKEIASILDKADCRGKIWLGAQGPMMLRIAKAFDGVLLNYSKPEMIEWAIHKADVTRNTKIGVYVTSYVYSTPKPSIRKLTKVPAAVVALGASSGVLKRFGLYSKLRNARKMARAAPNVEKILGLVPEEVVDDFSITMRISQLPTYLTELKRLGVSHVVFGYPQNHSVQAVKELGRAISKLREN